MAFSGPRADEATQDIRDDAGKWVELVIASGIPVSTLEVMQHGFGINSIGSMQATIRLEDDLGDFMHAIFFQPWGHNYNSQEQQAGSWT